MRIKLTRLNLEMPHEFEGRFKRMEEIIVRNELDLEAGEKEELTPYMGWLCGLCCESGIICS